MTRTTILMVASFALAATQLAGPAQAQNTRSFVSGLGSDSNNCSLAAPCRSFQHAHDQTNAGGEIAVLDTAGSARAVLFGVGNHGPIVTLFAASHPTRTRGLILANALASASITSISRRRGSAAS